MPRPFAYVCAAAVLLACVVAAAPLAGRPRQDVINYGKIPPVKRKVTLDGVTLTYDTRLAPAVTAAHAPAMPLQSPTDKPDWFWPAHVVFDLSAAYPAPPPGFRPEIHVCAVEDFRHAAAASERWEREVGLRVRDLRRLLRRRPAALTGEIPTVPFPDGHDAFRAHLKYLRFKGGSGVAYLAQGQQDEDFISNGRITYEFRGLTDDGRHYVYASLPVAAPFLPPARAVESHDGYRLPYTFYGPDRAAQLRRYRNYVARIRRRLERLPPDRFAPSLRLLDEAFSSLEINK